MAKVRVTWKPDPAMMKKMRDHVADTIIRPMAEKIAEDARAHAPVRTGALRDSIKFKITKGARRVRARIGSALHYAGFVEFGFVGRKNGKNISHHARPFLRQALANVFRRGK